MRDCVQNGVRPLFLAANGGHAEVTKLLIETGVNIDQANEVG